MFIVTRMQTENCNYVSHGWVAILTRPTLDYAIINYADTYPTTDMFFTHATN